MGGVIDPCNAPPDSTTAPAIRADPLDSTLREWAGIRTPLAGIVRWLPGLGLLAAAERYEQGDDQVAVVFRTPTGFHFVGLFMEGRWVDQRPAVRASLVEEAVLASSEFEGAPDLLVHLAEEYQVGWEALMSGSHPWIGYEVTSRVLAELTAEERGQVDLLAALEPEGRGPYMPPLTTVLEFAGYYAALQTARAIGPLVAMFNTPGLEDATDT